VGGAVREFVLQVPVVPEPGRCLSAIFDTRHHAERSEALLVSALVGREHVGRERLRQELAFELDAVQLAERAAVDRVGIERAVG
jgi:hypothetical protein